jgi:hypothetical protein
MQTQMVPWVGQLRDSLVAKDPNGEIAERSSLGTELGNAFRRFNTNAAATMKLEIIGDELMFDLPNFDIDSEQLAQAANSVPTELNTVRTPFIAWQATVDAS